MKRRTQNQNEMTKMDTPHNPEPEIQKLNRQVNRNQRESIQIQSNKI